MTEVNPKGQAKNRIFQDVWLCYQSCDNLLFGIVYRSSMSSEQNDCAFNPVIGKICSPALATFSYICVVGYFKFPVDPEVCNSLFPCGKQGG